MVAIEDELKKTSIKWLWGVFITSLRNHLYGMTMIRHRGKVKVLYNAQEFAFVNYIKKCKG